MVRTAAVAPVEGGASMSRSMSLSQLLPDVALPRDPVITGLVMDSPVRPAMPSCHRRFGTHGLALPNRRARGAAAVLFEPPAPAEFPVPADAIAVPGLRAGWARWATVSTAIPRTR
jgi:UDP-N-acetylmuramoyl-L-alanyl-D-glutamate--2,6-diaminopimelate ligase